MVFPENETVMLILGAGVLIFILRARSHLQQLRWWRILVLGYVLILTGWCATMIEHAAGSEVLNYVEHATYAIGAIVVAFWCWGGMRSAEEAD